MSFTDLAIAVLMSLFLNKTTILKQRQRTTQVGVTGGALPCVRLACVLHDKRTSIISPTLGAECKTARAGFDKSIG